MFIDHARTIEPVDSGGEILLDRSTFLVALLILMPNRIQLLSLAAADARSPVLYDARITSAAGPHDMNHPRP